MDVDIGSLKPKAQTRVVVAMSGGVDSSVAAALLHKAGYDVVGMTMQLYDYGEVTSSKTCCAGVDIYDARVVADQIGIPHYVLNYESKFKESVIEDFADSYVRGETPIPCIRCNESVKFRDMFAQAKSLGADALATGHYVRRNETQFGPTLTRAIDHDRDQSYFLFSTTKQQLDFLRFPIGTIPKSQTRKIAQELGLKVADKPDSQDICFVPDGNYAQTVAKLRPAALNRGPIVDYEGNVLGEHNGIINYTIGQRRGLSLGGLKEPMYVIALRPKKNEVVVGPLSALARQTVIVKDFNWLGYGNELLDLENDITVKLRSTQKPVKARVRPLSNFSGAVVELASPEYGLAPGQACVVYQDQRVLGGGWIHRAA